MAINESSYIENNWRKSEEELIEWANSKIPEERRIKNLKEKKTR